MLRFATNKKDAPAAQRSQAEVLANMREDAFRGPHAEAMVKICANAGLSPADAFREMDTRSTIEQTALGEFSTLNKAQAVSKSVSIGRTAVDYRKASDHTGGKSSMTGQTGVIGDKTSYTYAGSPVPIHDHGVIVDWREALSMGAEGFDYLTDEMRAAERVVMRTVNSYLWDGNANLKVKDRVWLGLKNDPTVDQQTTSVNLETASASESHAEIKRLRDILQITNRCYGEIHLAVSPEIFSAWERDKDTGNASNETVLQYIQKLDGIASIYRDSQLSGPQELFFAMYDQVEGLCAITGMAMSTYMKQRLNHNDNYEWIKWLGQGFQSRVTSEGRKCAMYVKAA